jgi:hypothetical protein
MEFLKKLATFVRVDFMATIHISILHISFAFYIPLCPHFPHQFGHLQNVQSQHKKVAFAPPFKEVNGNLNTKHYKYINK